MGAAKIPYSGAESATCADRSTTPGRLCGCLLLHPRVQQEPARLNRHFFIGGRDKNNWHCACVAPKSAQAGAIPAIIKPHSNPNGIEQMNKSSRGLKPSEAGVAVIRLDEICSGLVLLLGDRDNACALATSEGGVLAGIRVSDVICVADTKQAVRLEDLFAQRRQRTDEGAPLVSFRRFFMEDRLAPNENRTLEHIAAPLAALEEALFRNEGGERGGNRDDLRNGAAASAAEVSPAVAVTAEIRGVLCHCNMGHNRSPTLVLLVLLRRGFSLRDAYRMVLGARPSIDPLPSYRRLMRDVEAAAAGISSSSPSSDPSSPAAPSVGRDELFGLHVSELLQRVETSASAAAVASSEDVIAGVGSGHNIAEGGHSFFTELEAAMDLKEQSIAALIAEKQ